MVYQWKNGWHYAADAQAVGERLASLAGQVGDGLTPRAVVDDARSPKSPLHPCFEWDDAKAAEEYRVEQARAVIQRITVVIEERPTEPVRAFVSMRAEEGRRYRSTIDVLRDPVSREQMLDEARGELSAWREKYKALEELSDVFAVVDAQHQAA